MIAIRVFKNTNNRSKLLSFVSCNRSFCNSASTKQQQQQQDQLKVFKDNASKWWSGKEFSILRTMNEIRVPFVKNGLEKPLADCRILDVGCGGGILSEPLARLGANVLGIDPVFESINQAQVHAQTDEQLKDRLKYINCNIEDLSARKEHIESYDALIASEVIEHIEDVENFLTHCNKVIKPHGSLFITTINQTPLSWLGVIFFGEYVLKQLPKGTHTYEMFVSVKGLRVMLERLGFQVRLINGFMYEPIGGKFYWTPTTLTHYAVQAIKLPTREARASEKMNYQQKRHFTTSVQLFAKNKQQQRPKILLDREEMMSVIPYDSYQEKANLVISELENYFDNDLTTRANTASVDKLKIQLEGLNEPLELRDIAQIKMQGANLIVIDLSTTPEAIKPTMKALNELGNMNPQVEVNNIYVQIPRVTREHRENLVSVAKQGATKSRDKLKSLFSEYSSIAKRADKKVSVDLVRSAIENIQFDINNRIKITEEMLEKKVNQLLNSK